MKKTVHRASEAQRAAAAAADVYYVYLATLNMLQLTSAMPDVTAQLAAQMRVGRGMRPEDTNGESNDAARLILDAAASERESGYRLVRSQALMAMCAAVEYLVKATVVDQGAADPSKAAALLAQSKVRVSAHEVLGTEGQELWFSVVDQVYKTLSESDPSAYPRMVKLIRDYCHLPLGKEQQAAVGDLLTGDQVRLFNEAFLVRNCLVHNGGRVSATLARHTKELRGSVLELGKVRTRDLMRALLSFSSALSLLTEIGPL